MQIDILTLFPQAFIDSLNYSILKRSLDKHILNINVVNIRDFSTDTHKTVDDKPFGGGPGMVIKVDVLHKALQSLLIDQETSSTRIILLSSSGKNYSQEKAKELSKSKRLILICGHYEGVDERILPYVDEELSIGNYVLSGGEIPALVVIDSITRLLPGALGDPESSTEESFEDYDTPEGKYKLLEYPQYTQPAEYDGQKVPSILVSGDHQKIKEWRLEKSLEKTKKNRPDLIKQQPTQRG
ncbi:MAG: tRNA (guanosine(37)-N1)-methyltransferase TrmD [Candidatus Woykebacteria bacterium RIFCSPHIGHO2_12_FULL_43_10]|uniref:tRNA (guanine-N(1)-)-methyltransferase n=2 Tax=Candidatus Woykeibacteriota TaxID=1817899 RepID=A0A1G1WWR6_9BACT|nr:MAG: tRNA (guanosine(37)-N1)-methyltransferase TrmD [Candidatus Woykebacteria bacterium RIFCSPHIGHO2_02_FULL_43_16b]OGY28638.1 MAG: tRNA (guanosine(37)-N1)-methyltransferase TrmD [Candidatus Woykebacteria bacterium RIFCSPHIGHO2_01_FULL_43_29]OGY29052.1 MAG: tRNA (guanosine(37)-N1)-methyltransferase TrmD [Candidatus Woykebacteria bacterium RIFCSPHIGHO2_12_FULL_43_10]OGY32179.1 MAG: tRNA (guanosine(37)-N1)-methyltransferase TrmD [Candidatus Woykebacteria bacterium RIFCSPLOWO2_01_FULL_43_14]